MTKFILPFKAKICFYIKSVDFQILTSKYNPNLKKICYYLFDLVEINQTMQLGEKFRLGFCREFKEKQSN